MLWRSLVDAGARRDDDMRLAITLDLHEQRQSLRGHFRIGQNIFYFDQLGFGQEKRAWLPVQ